ncbi:hypothetical protein [Aurantiacibacter sp. MUD61]|uniref:hypothetical protein n=1 Tax=Aurantiacibacter sp. MUD61 TaxID=3009083 RepID=UPI0022F0D472|nr:hypothetical protein [Aurantiacibacter sp. MUD61]
MNFGVIEIVFFAVTALGFGLYQLWSVNREIKKDRARKAAEDQSAALPGHAEREHELGDR